MSSLSSSQAALETLATSAEAAAKATARELQVLQADLASIKAGVEKATKVAEENGAKIFGCVHDCDTLKDTVDKVKRAVERRPAAEEVDKQSELSNKLYNDLAAKIEDVDSHVQKEVKKTRSDSEKSNKDVARLQISVEEATKEIKFVKEDMVSVKLNMADIKQCPKDISTLKTECDKTVKDVKSISSNIDEVKKELATFKVSSGNASSTADQIKSVEKDLEILKKDKSLDKFTSVEKALSCLRADHEKLSKETKTVSTEVKYFDSTLKKEASNTKTELAALSKSIKDAQKDLDTLHNMIEVVNSQSGSSANSDDVTKVKTDLIKISTEIKESVTAKCKAVEDSLKKKLDTDKECIETKILKTKDDLTAKLATCTTEVKALEKRIEANTKGIDASEVDKRVKVVKDELNSSIEIKLKTTKDDITAKLASCTTEVKALEKRIEANTKGIDAGEVDKRVKVVKDELSLSIEMKLKTTEDEVNAKITAEIKSVEKKLEANSKGLDSTEVDKRVKLAKEDVNSSIETKIKAAKEDFNTKVTTCTSEVKALEKRIESNTKGIDSGEVDKRVKDAKDELNKSIEAKNKATKDEVKAAKEEFNTKVATCTSEVKALEKRIESNTKGIDSGEVDKRVKDAKDELNKSIDTKIKATKDDVSTKVDKCSTDITALTKKVEASSKAIDSAEVDKRVKSAKDELNTSMESKVKAAKDDLNTKISGCTTEIKTLEKKMETNTKGIDSGEVDKRVKSAKDELSTKIATDNKALEKKLETTNSDLKKLSDIGTKMTKQEESLAKLKTTVDGLETSNKSSKASGLQSGEDLKKEMDKMNQALKESIKSVETKVTSQESSTKGMDTINKGLETIKTGLISVENKVKEIDTVKTSLKAVETKVTAVETTTKNLEKTCKECTEKIGDPQLHNFSTF